MDYGLQGRVLLVTGGGSGIGRAIVLAAAQGGAHVAVADALAERAEGVATELRALGVRALACTLDVRDATACEATAARVEAELGPIDGMVASAGYFTRWNGADLGSRALLEAGAYAQPDPLHETTHT